MSYKDAVALDLKTIRYRLRILYNLISFTEQYKLKPNQSVRIQPWDVFLKGWLTWWWVFDYSLNIHAYKHSLTRKCDRSLIFAPAKTGIFEGAKHSKFWQFVITESFYAWKIHDWLNTHHRAIRLNFEYYTWRSALDCIYLLPRS